MRTKELPASSSRNPPYSLLPLRHPHRLRPFPVRNSLPRALLQGLPSHSLYPPPRRLCPPERLLSRQGSPAPSLRHPAGPSRNPPYSLLPLKPVRHLLPFPVRNSLSRTLRQGLPSHSLCLPPRRLRPPGRRLPLQGSLRPSLRRPAGPSRNPPYNLLPLMT